MMITSECKWVYRGWNWKCVGFRLRPKSGSEQGLLDY
jgi:hypothetical protein